MIEYNFNFRDLTLDLPTLKAVLGFPDTELPDPFNEYLDEALEFAAQLIEIKSCYLIIEDIKLDPSKGSVQANGRSFQVGKTICKELRGIEKLLFFVCSAGKSIGEKSAELLKGDDPAKGYIYDQVGIFLVEAAGDRMQQLIQLDLANRNEKMTNRYSPGYCHWSVADQHKLFSLFPTAPCGVTLTDSSLMNPVKSISGLIGIGKEVRYREYPCDLCLNLDCVYRKIHPGKQVKH